MNCVKRLEDKIPVDMEVAQVLRFMDVYIKEGATNVVDTVIVFRILKMMTRNGKRWMHISSVSSMIMVKESNQRNPKPQKKKFIHTTQISIQFKKSLGTTTIW